MTIEEIRELIRVVQETGIYELEWKQGDNTVRIRASAQTTQEMVVPTMVSVPVATTQMVAQPAPAIASTGAAETAATQAAHRESDNDIVVKSPIVGTYYDAPAPGAPPFVKIGDRVEPKQVLCIIESMKLMNEIEAETGGILMSKMVENGRPVEYGETLFTIRPH